MDLVATRKQTTTVYSRLALYWRWRARVHLGLPAGHAVLRGRVQCVCPPPKVFDLGPAQAGTQASSKREWSCGGAQRTCKQESSPAGWCPYALAHAACCCCCWWSSVIASALAGGHALRRDAPKGPAQSRVPSVVSTANIVGEGKGAQVAASTLQTMHRSSCSTCCETTRGVHSRFAEDVQSGD